MGVQSTDLPGDLGAKPRGFAIPNHLLEEALLRLRQHQPLQHPGALRRHVDRAASGRRHLEAGRLLQEPESARRGLERVTGHLDPLPPGPIRRKRDLAIHGAQIEEHGSLLELDRGEGGLLIGLEGVVPGEGEGRGDGRESGLDEGEGLEVGVELVASDLRRGVRWLLEGGAEVADGVEVVLGQLGVALGVVEGDVLAEGAVDVGGGRLLLVDRQHHVHRR